MGQPGIYLRRLHRHAEAAESYDRAILLDPGNRPAWFNKSAELIREGSWEAALKAIDIALTIRGSNGVSWYVRGLLLANLGRGPEAQAAFAKARALDERLTPVQYPFGGIRTLSRAYHPVSSDDIRGRPATCPGCPYLVQEGSLHVPRLSLRGGRGSCRPGTPVTMTASPVHGNSGGLLSINWEEIATHWRPSITPSLPMGGITRIWNIRGLVQKKLHDLPGALAAFDRAVSVNPLFFVGWHNRGLVLLQMNRFTDAISSFERALALNPGDKKTLNARSYAGKRSFRCSTGRPGVTLLFLRDDTQVTGYRVF